jgi:hypothetical protein
MIGGVTYVSTSYTAYHDQRPLTILIAYLIFPVSKSVSIPQTMGFEACSLIRYMISVVCLICRSNLPCKSCTH